jgi:hypothetical protein
MYLPKISAAYLLGNIIGDRMLSEEISDPA